MKLKATKTTRRNLIPSPCFRSVSIGRTPKGDNMKILIAVILISAGLFASEPAASVPSETLPNENIVMVGFDRFRDFELVSQALNCGTEKDLRYYVVSSDVVNR